MARRDRRRVLRHDRRRHDPRTRGPPRRRHAGRPDADADAAGRRSPPGSSRRPPILTVGNPAHIDALVRMERPGPREAGVVDAALRAIRTASRLVDDAPACRPRCRRRQRAPAARRKSWRPRDGDRRRSSNGSTRRCRSGSATSIPRRSLRCPTTHSFRLRLGTLLWHGDKSTMQLTADVLDVRPGRAAAIASATGSASSNRTATW